MKHFVFPALFVCLMLCGGEDFSAWRGKGTSAEVRDGVLHFKDVDPGNSNGIFGRHVRFQPEPVDRVLVFEADIRRISGYSGLGVHISSLKLHAKEQRQADGTGKWERVSLRVPFPANCSGAYLQILCAHGYGRTGEAEFRNLSWKVVSPEQKKEQGAFFPIYEDGFSGHWDLRGVARKESGSAAYSGLRGLEVSPPPGKPLVMRLRSLEDFVPVVNRALDLSEFRDRGGWFEFCIRPALPFTVGGVPPEKQSVQQLENGWRRVRIPLAELGKRNPLTALMDLPFSLPSGAVRFQLDRIGFRCEDPAARVRYGWSGNWKEKIEQEMASWKSLPPDPGNRPVIEKGTFRMNGKSTFLLGVNYPIASIDFEERWRNNRKMELPEYHFRLLDRKICEEFGLNTVQFPGLPFHYAFYRNNLPVWGVEKDEQRKRNCGNFSSMPLSVDPTGIYYLYRNAGALLNDPVNPQPKEILHQNPGWHAFVPLCPEHPVGKAVILGQLRDMSLFTRANNGNPFLYELINESTYDCRCRFNRARFAGALQKEFGTVAEMNRRFGTHFADFRSAAQVPDFASCPPLRAAWRKFLSDRFVELLDEMKKSVTAVDARPDLHFCQQILIAGLLTGGGSTMDQRKTMRVLDVLAIEGGYSYGFSENEGRWESDEMEAVLTRGVHFFSLVADYATAVVRGNPKLTVADQEHYCLRYDGKNRIPSLPDDFSTSLWSSIFHGVSASSLFNWSGGKWLWTDREGAKKYARSMKYRGAGLLNPYCYPHETLLGLRSFMNELEPLRELVLPMPRLKAPQAAILFSITSQRMLEHSQSLPNMENWYNALLRENLPAEFLFEEELSPEVLKKYRILFLPDLKHSLPGTLSALEAFVKRGGTIVCSDDALTRDEYGRSLNAASLFRSDRVLRCGKNLHGMALRDFFAQAFERAGVKAHLRLRTADGKKLRAAEAQVIDRGDAKLILLVNWRREKVLPVHLSVTDLADGNWVVTDPVSRCRIGRFDAADVRRGLALNLFPQERQLLLLEKETSRYFPDAEALDRAALAERIRRMNREIGEQQRRRSEDARKKREAQQRASLWKTGTDARFRTVDFSGAANMAFTDEVSGDRKGGWFDEGPQAGLPDLKPGHRNCSGIPFEILGGEKAVCVLGGKKKPYFPKASPAIPLSGKAKRLYFLQSCGWNVDGEVLLICELTYADGSRARIPMTGGRDIGDWHGLKVLPNARIGVSFWNSEKVRVGFYCTRQSNPHPEKELQSLKLISTGLSVPLIGAVTLEE